MPSDLFKSYIQAVKPYEPGKPIKELEREMGLRNIIKLASNENPLGPSRKAIRAMRHAIPEVHLYPESSCHYLVNRLSKELDLPENQILIGNGSNEIIELLARGFLSEGEEVLSSETTFLVYPILTQVLGGVYKTVPMNNFRYDLEALLNAITPKTKLIFIANPNNPTGTYVSAREMDHFLSRVPKNVLVCLDEAYVDFVSADDFPKMISYLKSGASNLVILRTFSKAYGLAGLRVGYAAAPSEIVAYLHKIRQPFNVNSLAQCGAAAALDDRFFLWRTKHLVNRGRKYFYKHLKKLGFTVIESEANFVLVDVGMDANEVFQALLKRGIIIRSMKAYGLTTYVRITIGRRSQNAQCVRALKKLVKETAGRI